MRRLLPLLLVGCTPGTDAPPGDTAETADTAEVPAFQAGPDVVVQVGTEVVFTATGADGDVLWDLGDGTQRDGAEVRHTYDAPGNHVAVAQLTRANGARATDTVRVTAHRRPAPFRPRHSSPVAVADDGRVAVAVPEAGHVLVRDGATNTYVPVCAGPRSVAWVGTALGVACEDDDTLAVWDGADVTTTDLGVGSRPLAVVGFAGADGPVWWLSANGTGELLQVDGDAITREPVGHDPRALALDANQEPWAARWRADQERNVLYRLRGDVTLAKDPGPDSDTGNRGVPTALNALAISPDGGRAFVGGTLANVDRGLFVDDPPRALTFETAMRATLRVVDTSGPTETFELRRQFDNHGQVNAFALSPLGNWLFLVHQGTHAVVRMDAYTLRAAGVILDAGQGVDGLVTSADGDTLYVHAWLDRELRAYDVSDPSVPSPPVLWTAPTVETEPLLAPVLRGKVLFHDSRDPRMGKHGYQTCNTCHPDGRDDGVVWDFTNRGEGLRNTITLEGRGGMAMGPVHWSGNFDEIQDFENDIRFHQGGRGLMTDDDFDATEFPLADAKKAGRSDDLDALALYVSSLSVTPPSPHAMPDGGLDLFAAKGCDTCHDPSSHYTDSSVAAFDAGRHDVGTMGAGSGQRLAGVLDGIDTPTLLGVHATPPYLHDGSALTVEAAIRAHDGEGVDGSALTQAEVDTLADVVRALPQAAYDVADTP